MWADGRVDEVGPVVSLEAITEAADPRRCDAEAHRVPVLRTACIRERSVVQSLAGVASFASLAGEPSLPRLRLVDCGSVPTGRLADLDEGFALDALRGQRAEQL